MPGRFASARGGRRPVAVVAAGAAAVLLGVAGCAGSGGVQEPIGAARSSKAPAGSSSSTAGDAPVTDPVDVESPAPTQCSAIADESLPKDRSLDTVMDAQQGLLTVTYNSGTDPNETLAVEFLTDPTCLPGTRIWAVIDGAVSGAVQSGHSPYQLDVDYPHALYTHCGVAETRFAGQNWVTKRPLGNGDAPPGWDNPQQAGTMRLLTRHAAEFRDDAGHTVDFIRESAPQRPPCR